MARTLTTSETGLYSSGEIGVHLSVRVKDGAGNWVTLTDHEDENLVLEVEHTKDIDSPVESATVRLVRSIYHLKLSPLFSASKFNNPATGAEERLGLNREIVILVAIMPPGSGEPAAGDWRLLFHGDVDQIDVAGLTLQCVDLGGRLQRLKMERAGAPDPAAGGGSNVGPTDEYVEPGTSEDAESVMVAILEDWAPDLSADWSTDLYVPVSPAWELIGPDPDTGGGYVPPDGANVLDALRAIASQIGWDVRYVYDATIDDPFGVPAGSGGLGGFRLTFYEPDRTNTTPDLTLTADQYRNVTVLEDILASVANRVEVMYWDAVGSDRVMRSVISEDAGSQTAFGVLYMRVTADQIPGILEESDAQSLADAILHDVSDPTAAMGVEADFRYDVEIYDLIRFSANGELWDSNQDLAVSGVRHTFAEGRASTSIALRGTIAGHRAPWWQNGGGLDDGLPQYDGPISDEPYGGGLTTPDLSHDVVLGGVQLRVDNPPQGYSRVDFHVSTSGASFTPSAATLVQSVRGLATGTVALAQGTTHYARAVVVNAQGIASAPSTAVTFAPGTQIDQVEVEESFAVTKAHADGQPYAATIDPASTNYCPNPSFEVDASGWTQVSSADDDPTLSRVTSERLFGDACLLVDSNDAAPIGEIGIVMDTADAAAAAEDETWSCSAWAKMGSGTALVRTLITFLDSSDAAVGGSGGLRAETVGTEWVRLRQWGTAPATTAKVVMGVRVHGGVSGPFDLYVDGCQLEKSLRPTNYFDGDFVGATWAGTEHDSTSTRVGGLQNLGALQADAPSFAVYDDGEVACGPITPSADTAVSIGLPGAARRIAGAGTDFPDDPEEFDTFFRTDRGTDYYYDGTRWLSVQEHVMTCVVWNVVASTAVSADSNMSIIPCPTARGGTQVLLTKLVATILLTGSAMDASNRWNLQVLDGAGSSIYDRNLFTEFGATVNSWQRIEKDIDSVRTVATDKHWRIFVDETGAPPTYQGIHALHYRLIG